MLSSRQKITTVEVTPTSRPICLGTKPGEFCGNPNWNQTQCAWSSLTTFKTTATALFLMPPNPDELKIRTKQLLRFACHQKHLHSGDETSKRSVQSGLLYLGVSDGYSSSRLCLSPAFRLCRLFLRTHQSLTVLTVLSCSPPDSLHLLFSPPPPFLPTVPLPPMLPFLCLPRLCFVTSSFPSTLLRPHTQSWPLVCLPFLLCVGLFCECVSRKARRLFSGVGG